MLPAENAGGVTSGSPISTLTGIGSLRSTVCHRNKAKIEAETSSRPCATELPQELVEMILAHLPLDTPTLKACSVACRSLYLATLPHLHHTLICYEENSDSAHEGFTPIRKLGEMQLLPLVKHLQIVQCNTVARTIPNAQTLVHFSALTNVQELGLDEVDLPTFTPQAQQYFGHFAPTLRSLALRRPSGTHSQLLGLLGLFHNLDDFKLISDIWHMLESDPVPVPQSAPPLRGRLTLAWFNGEVFLRALSEPSGGLRFRYMDLDRVEGAHFLLDTCVDTLDTLRIYPVFWPDLRGSQRDFDLSKLRLLRCLEITVWNMAGYSSDATLTFFGGLLPTIASPVFSDVVLVLQGNSIREADFLQRDLVSVVRGMYEMKPFRLVFCLEVPEERREDTTERLKTCIKTETAEGRLDFLHCPPVIVYERWDWLRE